MSLAVIEDIPGLGDKVDILVADLQACADAVAALGAVVDAGASVKTDIAVAVAAIIAVSNFYLHSFAPCNLMAFCIGHCQGMPQPLH